MILASRPSGFRKERFSLNEDTESLSIEVVVPSLSAQSPKKHHVDILREEGHTSIGKCKVRSARMPTSVGRHSQIDGTVVSGRIPGRGEIDWHSRAAKDMGGTVASTGPAPSGPVLDGVATKSLGVAM